MRLSLIIFAAILFFSSISFANTAFDINRAALDTKNLANLYIHEGKVILYDQQTNGPDTKNGKWGCAKVVSIILRKAAVKMEVERGVSGVESSLKKWQRITSSNKLKPGDVVVWTSRLKGNSNGACTGGGTCHIGIYTSAGYFHNDPLGDKPIFNGIGLLGYSFKIAFRPPDSRNLH